MEELESDSFVFVPCTRMRDRMRAENENHGNHDGDAAPFLFPDDIEIEEVELRPGAGNSAVDFLHPDFMLEILWQLTHHKIVWLGRDILIAALDSENDEDGSDAIGFFCRLFGYGSPRFSVHVRPIIGLDTDGPDNRVDLYSHSEAETNTTACDYLFQLMTRSNSIWTYLIIFYDLTSVSSNALSGVLNNSRNSGGTIHLSNECFSTLSQPQLQEYMRVFEDSTSAHHKIGLQPCTDWSQELIVTVTDFLHRFRCAIGFVCYKSPVPHPLIIDALRGKSNIAEVRLCDVSDIDKLVRALAENRSLVRLSIVDTRISDDNWTVLCQALSRHPKLESLCLFRTFPCGVDHDSNESNKTRRTNVFLEMLQANTVLQKLDTFRDVGHSGNDEFDERILADVIQPYFRHLEHVRALGQNRVQNDGPNYAKVLALALNKVDDSPALTWMLIRGNIPTILGLEEGNEEEAIVMDA
jgi:hypothetical protein